MLERVAVNVAETVREGFSVAVFAAKADSLANPTGSEHRERQQLENLTR
jgi:hypothetical protein